MDTSGITYSDETTWDASRGALQFYADIGETRIMCCIGRAALNDYYRTEDTNEKAFENYNLNKKFIHSIATRFIEQDRFNDRRDIFINLQDLRNTSMR